MPLCYVTGVPTTFQINPDLGSARREEKIFPIWLQFPCSNMQINRPHPLRSQSPRGLRSITVPCKIDGAHGRLSYK